MSKTKLKKLASKMEELSNLQDQISSLIDKYNLISLEIDNDSRLALLIAESNKDDYYFSEDYVEDNQNTILLTHDQFAKNESRPSLSIIRKNATAWFPSQFC